ncbi:unnamed protein product, partial [Mesorhabditis spiculigera]
MRLQAAILLCIAVLWSPADAQDEAKMLAAWHCCDQIDGCCVNMIRHLRPVYSTCSSIADEETATKIYECANKALYPEQKWVSMQKKDELCTVVLEENLPDLLQSHKAFGCVEACHRAAITPGLSNDDITATLRLSCTLRNQRYKCYRRCLDQLADGTLLSPSECVCLSKELQLVGNVLAPTIPLPTVDMEGANTPEEQEARVKEAWRLHRIKFNLTTPTKTPKNQQ